MLIVLFLQLKTITPHYIHHSSLPFHALENTHSLPSSPILLLSSCTSLLSLSHTRIQGYRTDLISLEKELSLRHAAELEKCRLSIEEEHSRKLDEVRNQ